MAEFRLTDAQAAAVAHRGSSLLLSAGAGSGKTRVLTERLMDRVCREGLDIDAFLLITYTRAAASELRSRILAALRERLRRDPGSRHLRRQTVLLQQTHIGTVHALCASLLREHAQLLGLRPDFRQLEGAEEQQLRSEVLREVLARRYEDMSEDFRAVADTLGAGRDDSALMEVILGTYDAVQCHPDPEAWVRMQRILPLPAGDVGESPWGRLLLNHASARAAFWQGQMEAAVAAMGENPNMETAYGPSFRATAESLADFGAALALGWDAAAAFPGVVFPPLKGFRGAGDDPLALHLKALRSTCKDALEKLSRDFDASSADLRGDMAALRPVSMELLSLVLAFSRAYGEEKRKRGVLDFSDLEHLTLRLLTEEDRQTPTELAKSISLRWEEILVDEYQDCNRVQDRLFHALSREGRNLTMVGDVKQSIYRFRLADPGIFLEKYDAYADDPGPGEGRRIFLSENFRSDPGILRAVNAFFAAAMSRELGELDYGEKEALKPAPGAEAGEGSFRFFVGRAGEDRLKTEAAWAADYVSALLRSGMTVPEGEGERPLRPGDIAILLRSAKGKDGVFAEALRERGIPASCLKSADSLSERREVIWARSLLEITDNPRQDIPLLTALRSPVFGFTEDRLAEVRSLDKAGDFFSALNLAAGTEADCRAVLEALNRWRARSQTLPADEFLQELCAETELRALAEARERGGSAGLDALIAGARDFGETGKRDLYSFLEYLRASEALETTAMTAPGGAGEGVVITTVHGSKGLEYPVVLLADLMKPFNREDTRKSVLMHPDLGLGLKCADRARGIEYPTLPRLACARKLSGEMLSEELRVLYVAMTRAKQHLALFLGLRDPAKARRKYDAGMPAPLPPELLAEAGSWGAWLLSASLALGGEDWAWREPPAEAEMLLPAAVSAPGETVDPELLRARLSWTYGRAADTRLPSKLTATALRESFRAQEAAEGATDLPGGTGGGAFPPLRLGDRADLTPAERGTAMHLAMQYADLAGCDTPQGAAEAVAELRKRRLLTPEQCDAVDAGKLTRFCRSEVYALLRRGEVHREFKFSLLVPLRELLGEGEGETLLQGVVDLWSETEEGICLLDYKTDRVTGETQAARAEEYRPQLMAYALALERMTGKKVLRRFLWFFATGEAVEV